MSHNSISSKILIRDVLKSIFPWLIGVSVVCTFWAIDVSLRPYVLKTIIDRMPGVDPENILLTLIGPVSLYLGLSILIICMFRFREFVYLNIQAKTKIITSNILMRRMLQHSLVVYQNNFAGNLASKIKDVMSGFPDTIKAVDELIGIFMSLIIATLTLATISYQFSLLMLAWIMLFIYISIKYSKPAKIISVEAAEYNSILIGQIVDVFNNIVSVKLFSKPNQELKEIDTIVKQKVAADQRRDWFFLRLFSLFGLTFIIYQISGFALLLFWYKLGRVTVGDFALLTSLNIAVVSELWSLSMRFSATTELVGNVSQGLKIALQPIDVLDQKNAGELVVKDGNITFDKVTFNYQGIAPIFTDKSVIIAAGQKIGLVGYSGGGKTTFVNLILRLYEIVSGRISIDGQNIQQVTQDSLHAAISMIPQDPILFHRTVLENIRYGREDASDDEVIAAAKHANAHEFISNLPLGYASMVGDRGVKLSGGQRQRIAIARAFLKNAPILILDEATSQLDSVTEQEIQASLSNLMRGKTTIVIAHRLSTLLHMDRILVFSKGKITQDGTHAQLLEQEGLYKELWDAQVGGFLIDNVDNSSFKH